MALFFRRVFQLLFCLMVAFSGTGALAATSAQSISAPSRVDMVYDDARGVLYITSGTDVLRYQLSSKSFLTPYSFALGNLSGIDLSPDGNTLAVADRNVTGIHLIDLSSDTVKPDVLFTPALGEAGSYAVAFGNDGALLVTTAYNGSGSTPLRRVDPETGAVQVIQDLHHKGMISASADGSCIAHVEKLSNGALRRYDVATQQIVDSADTNWYNYEVGVNRNCTQFAVPTYGGTFIYDSTLDLLGTVGVYASAQPIGAAYHPLADIVYYAWYGTSALRAYHSTTGIQLGSFDVGYIFQQTGNNAFNQGRLKISRDGSLLFVTVAGGIKYVNSSLHPVAQSQSLYLRQNSGGSITLSGSSPRGLALGYTVLSQPAHGTLTGSAPNLSYTPDPGYGGPDSFSFKVSDGTLESQPATVSITLDGSAPVIDHFLLPASSTALTVPVSALSASDDMGVTGYCLTESSTAAGCLWSATPPASYRFGASGSKTLYAFARDSAGNVSDGASAATSIPEILPQITAFSIPARYGYQNLTIPVTLSASDDLGVTGYCLSESSDPAGCAWRGWAPTSYTFAAAGHQTLYAFARNSAGKVSTPASASTSVVGQVNFIPAAARTDMVYDGARDLVYIANGAAVLRYRLATQSFLAPFSFGAGSLTGMDLSPDGKTLAVADKKINGVHLIDLESGTVQPDVIFTAGTGEAGTHSVAFGADGALLVSAKFSGSGSVPLRRVDPATGAVTVIKEEIRQDAMLSASADGQCIAFEESNISNGPVSIYRVATQSVTGPVPTNGFTYELGSNRNCSQFAVPTYGGTFIYNQSLNKIGTIGSYGAAQPLGVAYSPVSDLVYFAWIGSPEVRAYDSGTWQQSASFDFGHTFSYGGNRAYESGRLKVARDGSLLFGTVADGVRYQRVGGADPAADNQAVIAYAGIPTPITLTGSSPTRSALSYGVTTPPAHGTLQGTAPRLVYTPNPGYSGVDSIVFKVSDGSLESNSATMTITVRPVLPGVAILTPQVKGELTLIWGYPADPGFSHIHIYRSTTAGTLGTLIADNLTGASYTNTGLAPDTLYYYTVRWVDGAGIESSNSAQVSRRTLEAVAPVSTATPAGGSYRSAQQVTLSCNDNGGSGCAATYYCLGTNCTPTTPYSQGIALAGSNTLRFFSTDRNGNSEAVRSAGYTIEPRFITATPSSLYLGTALVHYPVSTTVAIANAGSLPLSVSASILTGPDQALFSVAPGGTAPCSSLTPTLAPQQSCTLTVTLTPDAQGYKNASLQIASNADNSPAFSVPLSGVGVSPASLTTLITGNGSVNNIASSAAFACDAPSCTALFAAGTSVTLRATPASLNGFSGWSGGGCGGVSDCVIDLVSDTTVTATFVELPLVRINGSAASYRSFTAALADLQAAAIIRSRNVTITDSIDLKRPLHLTILGGLAEDFATGGGVTVVDGKISVSQGSLTVKGLAVR